MTDISLQHPNADVEDFWRRQFSLETDRRIAYAGQNGYQVLPITQPISGYIVTHGRGVMARCNLLMEAVEVAAALAFYREHGRPSHGS